MTPCDQIAHSLADGEPLPPDLRTHLEMCPPCRELAAIDAGLRAPDDVRPLELSTALRDAIRDDHDAIPDHHPLARALAPLGFSMLLAGSVLLVHPRPDFGHLMPSLYWGVAAAWIVLLAAGLVLVFARGRLGLGPSALTRWVYIAISIALFEGLAWGTNPRGAYSISRVGMHEWMRHWTCAPLGLLFASLVGFLVMRAARHQEAVSPATAGAVAGAASGFGAVLALHACCGFPDPLHLAVVHAVPLVVGVLVGVTLGRHRMAP